MPGYYIARLLVGVCHCMLIMSWRVARLRLTAAGSSIARAAIDRLHAIARKLTQKPLPWTQCGHQSQPHPSPLSHADTKTTPLSLFSHLEAPPTANFDPSLHSLTESSSPESAPSSTPNFDPSLLTRTENNSATFSSSADPCIDFFFQIVPDTPPSKIVSLLVQAWRHDPLTALKLIFHLRGVRGTGKSNKDAFYVCASWLHQHHPKSLLANLHLVAKFGYFKDLLEIVLREVEGREETEKRLQEKEERDAKVEAAKAAKKKSPIFRRNCRCQQERTSTCKGKGYWSRKGEAARQAKKAGVLQDRDTRIAASLERDQAEKEKASELRRQKREAMACRAKIKYKGNPTLAALYDAVAEIFAKQLVEDKNALDTKCFFDISFAAKWCPSAQSSYDLRTGLYNAIACLLFSRDKFPHLDEDKYAIEIAYKMRKEFLVPLRQALEIPEIYMCANKWGILPYERVPSVAMKVYMDQFVKHDKDRYMDFLAKVAVGKKKVAAGALLPHQVAKDAVEYRNSETRGPLAEAQWRRMVSDLKESGSKLSSSMAICDVSGSMMGTPMEVCIALGLLVAELSEEPWKNRLCTFSNKPKIHLIEGKTLAERYTFTRNMYWATNTNFQLVFRTLIDLAVASKVPPEKMIKRLFVFSDMEFDEASANPWETDYMMITKMYEEAGYGEPPEIIFWNLRDSISTPVLSSQKGVALVSGFSKNLLKVFLENDDEPLQVPVEDKGEDEPLQVPVEDKGEDDQGQNKVKRSVDPKEVMTKALSGELYEELKVVD